MAKLLLSYLRKSVLKDDSKTSSPERQRAAVISCTPPGWVNRWYEDLDYSGSNSNRPGWQQLLTDLQDYSLDIGGVAAETLSRLYRNRSEFETLKKLIDLRDCELIIANMIGVDGRTASGRLLLNIQSDVDQFWTDQTSESMRETIATIQAGGRHWGTRPFGTDRDPITKHLVASEKFYLFDPRTGHAYRPDDPAAPATAERRHYFDALRELFTVYASGRFSFQDASEALHAGGWYFWQQDQASPQAFTRQTVRSILQRWSIYMGELGAASAPPQRRQRRPGGHQPILPPELCEQVGAVYERRSREKPQGHSNQSEHNYLLTGVLYCGACGQRMCGQHCPRRAEPFFYRHLYSKGNCHERITPASALEGPVIASLIELGQSGPILQALAGELRAILTLASQGDSGPAALLEEREREMARLTELFTRGLVDLPTYEKQYHPLKAELDRLRSQQAASQPAGDVEAVIVDLLANLGRLEEAPPEVLRTVVLGMFERIEARGKRVTGVKLKDWARPLAELLPVWGRGQSETRPTPVLFSWLSIISES